MRKFFTFYQNGLSCFKDRDCRAILRLARNDIRYFVGALMIKRGTVNFIVDVVSFIDLLCLACTGFIMKFILPPGSGGYGRGFRGGRSSEQIKELWSMTRHEWGTIHFYLALLFVFLMIVHIILHWEWIKSYFKSVFGRLDT
jgi:hypothetical protein